MFIVLDGHATITLSIATVASMGAGILAYYLLVAQDGGSSSSSSWQIQITGSSCETISGVIGQKSNVGGNLQEVHHQ